MDSNKKYHIDINGLIQECHADIRVCPRGGNINHYSTKEEGQMYADLLNELGVDLAIDKEILINKEFSIKDLEERQKIIERFFSNPMSTKFNTKNHYFNPITNLWDKERNLLHQEILNELEEKYKNIPNDKKLIISGGLSGSGKGTMLNHIFPNRKDEYAVIDSDEIKMLMAQKGMIPQIKGLTQMECANLIHDESSYLADALNKKLTSQGKNIIYDITCGNLQNLKTRLSLYISKGYKPNIHFVNISIDTAKERAMSRYKIGMDSYIRGENEFGGRFIPNHVIEKRKSNSENYLSTNEQIFHLIRYDGDLKCNTYLYENEDKLKFINKKEY